MSVKQENIVSMDHHRNWQPFLSSWLDMCDSVSTVGTSQLSERLVLMEDISPTVPSIMENIFGTYIFHPSPLFNDLMLLTGSTFTSSSLTALYLL